MITMRNQANKNFGSNIKLCALLKNIVTIIKKINNATALRSIEKKNEEKKSSSLQITVMS